MDKTINIQGTEYPVRFKFRMFRILGDKWGCKGPFSVINKFRKQIFPDGIPEDIGEEDDEEAILNSMDFPFESSRYFLDLINAAIVTAGGSELDMTLEEFEDEIMMDMETLAFVTTEFMANISKQQESGNAEPRSKARKTATKKKPAKKKN